MAPPPRKGAPPPPPPPPMTTTTTTTRQLKEQPGRPPPAPVARAASASKDGYAKGRVAAASTSHQAKRGPLKMAYVPDASDTASVAGSDAGLFSANVFTRAARR